MPLSINVSKSDTVEILRQQFNLLSDITVQKTTDTGSALIPVGSSAERQDQSPPETGSLRFNTDFGWYEGFNGTEWIPVSSISDYFERLNSSSFQYDGSGRITQITYSSGHKQTFEYTGDTSILITYMNTDDSVIQTCTIEFDVNGNTSSIIWS